MSSSAFFIDAAAKTVIVLSCAWAVNGEKAKVTKAKRIVVERKGRLIVALHQTPIASSNMVRDAMEKMLHHGQAVRQHIQGSRKRPCPEAPFRRTMRTYGV